MKCTPQKSPRESDANSPFLVKYTTVVVPSRQSPCKFVIFTRKPVIGINRRQMYAVGCHAIVIAEAFMPASSNHFTMLFLAKTLPTKTRYDFRFLATMP